MQQVEFTVPSQADLTKTDALVERVCAAHGLHAALKGTLATYPGSIHWHYKKPKQKGTLELTLLRADRRIWASIHSNRGAPWIEASLSQLRAGIERALRAGGELS